jgi:CheY-like chemotaxis protein
MSTNKRILLIEDDWEHIKWIREGIRGRWPEAVVDEIRTEKALVDKFDSVAGANYDLVIIDQAVPYASVEDKDRNRARLELNAFRAGSRCYDRLRKDPRTQDVPLIFYTIHDKIRVPPDAVYVQKSSTSIPTLLDRAEKELAAVR